MKLLLAPIQGMTIACYRNAFARIFGGMDTYYAPFISTAEPRKISLSLFKDLLPERNDPALKLVPQLLGNNGTDFKAYASVITDMGYTEINWNIGCPFPMVAGKKKGCGLLPFPEMIRKFLDAACSGGSYTLTIKMRLGLEDPEEGMDVIRVLNEYPLGGVIIHARTGVQMYTGSVDPASFGTLASACRHEVTYNGDITTQEDFLTISRRFPSIQSFMLGRGALEDPFLPSGIKGMIVPAGEKMARIRQLHDEIFNYYKTVLSGDKHLCDKMKGFWSYLSVHTDKDGRLMKRIKKCNTAAAYLDVVNPILHSPTAWSDSPFRHEK